MYAIVNHPDRYKYSITKPVLTGIEYQTESENVQGRESMNSEVMRGLEA